MLTFNAITHTCNMGKHKKKTCNVCFKSMRGINLKKHMIRKVHLTEQETKDNVVTKGLYGGKTEDNVTTKGQKISYTSVMDEDLEKRLHAKMKEFNSRIEMGRKVKLIVDKNRYNLNGLDNDMMEALKI